MLTAELILLVTLLVGAVAKYCDEHVCVCIVCLSTSISLEPHVRSLRIFLYGRGSVLLRQGDEIPRGRGNFGGCAGHSKALAIFAAAVTAAKGITQSSITSRTRRDHSCLMLLDYMCAL